MSSEAASGSIPSHSTHFHAVAGASLKIIRVSKSVWHIVLPRWLRRILHARISFTLAEPWKTISAQTGGAKPVRPFGSTRKADVIVNATVTTGAHDLRKLLPSNHWAVCNKTTGTQGLGLNCAAVKSPADWEHEVRPTMGCVV